MGHLRRIVLIHTHLAGVVELLLDANANICGSNATGKTTLQRLLPVFFGEQPNRVVPRTRKSFHEFYLPHQNSYLIYEYVREAGDVALVVLTRHSQGGVEYRFVKTPYAPELFLEQTEQGPRGLSYQALTARLREAGVTYSAKLEATSEYRSVIQNDFTQLRGRNREDHRLYQMASQYSLVNPSHRLRHMEKLVSAVHAKEGKMDTLKTMLAAIFEEDGVALPVTRLRNQEARRWISQMRQSLRLEHLNQLFSSCQESAMHLAHTESSLHQLAPLLKQDHEAQERQYADAAEKLHDINKQLDALKTQYQAQRSIEMEKKLEREQTLNTIVRTLDDIQRRYDDFLDKDMEALARDMEQLPSWRSDLARQSEHLALIKAEYGDKQQEFERRKAVIFEHLSKQREEAAERRDSIQEALDSLRKQHQALRDQEQQRYQGRREEVLHSFSYQEAQLGQQISETLTELRGSFLTPAELASQEEAQLRVERNQEISFAALRAVSERKEQYQKAKKAHEEALTKHQKLRQNLAIQEQQLYRLQQQFEPETGTLRHFLREQMPGWEQTIGKLIREELLVRTDLSPQHVAEDNTSFAGLKLDLASLSAPSFALEEQAFQLALDEARHAVAQSQSEIEQDAQQVQRYEQQVREQAERMAEAEHDVQVAEQEVLFATQARDVLKDELAAKTKQRRAELVSRQAALEERQAHMVNEREQRLAELERDYQQKRLELQADSEENQAREQERLIALRQRLKEQEKTAEREQEELSASFQQELEAEGVNTQLIHAAEVRLQTLDKQIRAVESRRDELEEYQRFMRVEWAQKPEYIARETELQNMLRESEDRLMVSQRTYEAEQQQLVKQQQAWQAEQLQSQQFVEALAPLVEQLQQLKLYAQESKLNGLSEFGEQSERIERGRHLLEQRHQQELRLRQQLSGFEAELTDGADEHFRERLHHEQQRLQQDNLHLLDALAPYEGMLQLLRNQQAELLQQGRNMGGDLSKFFTVFHDVNQRIHTQSQRLSHEVAHEMNLDGISRAEVKIQSTIDQLDFWEPLKRFSALHYEWENSGEEIPSEAYLNALGEVAELLRQDQQYRFENLLQLELHLTEGNHDLVIRNDRQLLESSSHGMAYLILCQFLLAFTRLLRGSAQVKIHWPIDEIGTLAYANVEQLFRACEANNILILGAFPNPESDVLGLFEHRYLIEKEESSEIRRLKRIEPQVSPLALKLQAHREALL